MAVLKLYNQIVDEEDKLLMQWSGFEAICFKDITNFLNGIEEDDNSIDIRIHCVGGDVTEGWAMYDALRASGKEISVTVEGQCSSMATIILMAAPQERRFGTPNSRICIHNPCVAYMSLYTNERLTAQEMEKLQAKMKAQQLQLEDEQKRILDLYVERTGTDASTLQALMDEDKYIDVDKAIELGFIGEKLAPNTDSKKPNKFTNMTKEVKVSASLLDKALAKLGLAKLEDLAPKEQVITAANGDEIVVEREEGEPAIGDKATIAGQPEGSAVLDDGRTVTVKEGVITTITEPTPVTDEKDAKIQDLEAKVADYESKVTALKDENAKIKAEAETAATTALAEKQAVQDELDKFKVLAKNEEETAILDTVNKAGGKKWLDKVASMTSTFGGSPVVFRERKDPSTETDFGKEYIDMKRKKSHHV